mmetsp:Transcript_4396/g.10417  ORF Transcript_4396/g.10417 Transcript_4396/m.10417 type:complete len:512 (+) Transcript_4396:790-2325(+)
MSGRLKKSSKKGEPSAFASADTHAAGGGGGKVGSQHGEGSLDISDEDGGDKEDYNDDNEEEGEEDESASEEEEMIGSDEDIPMEGDEELVFDEHGEPIEDAVPEAPPALKWKPPMPLTDEQKAALRWYAKHPADPFGAAHPELKASVLHKENPGEVRRYWLNAPKKKLPDKETRDYVLQFRRLEEEEQPMRLSVVGLPSTGKSSIINALLQEDRCIVDEADGTTMDAVVSDWSFKGEPVKLIDTCGVIKGWNYPGSYTDLLQAGMGTRKAIRRSHVVVVCIDPVKHRKMTYYSCPSRFEIKLAQYVLDEGKALVLAVNKWDLISEQQQEKIRDDILKRIQDQLPDCRGVPVIFMSAKYNLNLSMLMIRAATLYKRWGARLPTSKLNNWLQAWMLRWPPPWRNGMKCTVKYMTQTRSRPPTFVLWTNTTWDEMPRNYIRHIQNAMREEFKIYGVPIKFILRSTLMPRPFKKMSKKEVLRWKRLGPRQAAAVADLNSKKMLRRTHLVKNRETE